MKDGIGELRDGLLRNVNDGPVFDWKTSSQQATRCAPTGWSAFREVLRFEPLRQQDIGAVPDNLSLGNKGGSQTPSSSGVLVVRLSDLVHQTASGAALFGSQHF